MSREHEKNPNGRLGNRGTGNKPQQSPVLPPRTERYRPLSVFPPFPLEYFAEHLPASYLDPLNQSVGYGAPILSHYAPPLAPLPLYLSQPNPVTVPHLSHPAHLYSHKPGETPLHNTHTGKTPLFIGTANPPPQGLNVQGGMQGYEFPASISPPMGLNWQYPQPNQEIHELKPTEEEILQKNRYNLAVGYEKGIDVEQNMENAITYYRLVVAGPNKEMAKLAFHVLSQLAQEYKNPTARREVAYCYEKGFGVIKDHGKALESYKMAAEQGDETAKSALMNIARSYETKGQISEAKDLYDQLIKLEYKGAQEALKRLDREHHKVNHAAFFSGGSPTASEENKAPQPLSTNLPSFSYTGGSDSDET